ncbi:MAG TPA: hypothetical protein VHA56_16230 [Mucilaginibacter sp.]|nr:hypothetical protein [Mucilaginibacter sp.]
MALPKENVRIAIDVLRKVAGTSVPTVEIDGRGLTDEDRALTDFIILYDEKFDGGWENVALNIKNMTKKQRDRWHELKGLVKGNTNFLSSGQNGLTMIGYI